MATTSSIERKVLDVLRRDEHKIVEALRGYYRRFGTATSITFQGAASINGANPAYMVDYMFYRSELGFPSTGMPELREDALQYLANLEKHPSIF